MTNRITTDDETGISYTIPEGLTPRTRSDGSTYGAGCDDVCCSAWEYAGETLRHGKNCDTRDLQMIAIATSAETAPEPVAQTSAPIVDVRTAAREGNAYAVGYDVDDLVSSVYCGEITMSDAMNQDF